MNRIFFSALVFSALILLCSCSTQHKLKQYAKEYKKNQSVHSLAKIIQHFPENTDTSFVKNLLGEPIDMGFDYRYLTGVVGENGCEVGAVFHINEGKIDQYWFGEICE